MSPTDNDTTTKLHPLPSAGTERKLKQQRLAVITLVRECPDAGSELARGFGFGVGLGLGLGVAAAVAFAIHQARSLES